MVATLTVWRTPMSASTFETPAPGRALRIGLWAAQVALAFVFISAGFVKLTTPIPQLAAMMPWAGSIPRPSSAPSRWSISPAALASCCRP